MRSMVETSEMIVKFLLTSQHHQVQLSHPESLISRGNGKKKKNKKSSLLYIANLKEHRKILKGPEIFNLELIASKQLNESNDVQQYKGNNDISFTPCTTTA